MMTHKIIKESLKVLLIGSLLSSIGGLSLEVIKDKLAIALPLIIILPAFASMVGNAGIISVSKITTQLYINKEKHNKFNSNFVFNLFLLLLIVFCLSSFYVTFLSILIAYLNGFVVEKGFIISMFSIVLLTVITIVSLVFFVAVVGSRYAFKRKIDPDDLLIPITTSIADFGSLIVFSLLVFFIL